MADGPEVRVTQNYEEVVVTPATPIRVTQNYVETVVLPSPVIRVTQNYVEVVVDYWTLHVKTAADNAPATESVERIRRHVRSAEDNIAGLSDVGQRGGLVSYRNAKDYAFVIDFASAGAEVSPVTFPETVAESRPHYSRNNVYAVQFASQQSNPVQLVPDDDFRDPALAQYNWSSLNSWQRVGDALLSYNLSDHSVVMRRFVEPPPRAITRTGGIVQGLVMPPFYDRQFTVIDEAAAAATYGGLQSPTVAPSRKGRLTAAARVVLDTDLTSPLVLQIVSSSNDYVLAEKEISGHAGERLEWWVEYDIGSFYIPPPPPPTFVFRGIASPLVSPLVGDDEAEVIPIPPPPPVTNDALVRVRLIQRGKSDDAWRLDTLSAFDDAIVWEFSVNGGETFLPANRIRNKKTGVLRFPEPGNALVYRVTGTRPGVVVSSVKVRPWYAGPKNARASSTHRGPNVSVFDQDPPIQDDPEWNAWDKPVPRHWFHDSRRFPLISPTGAPVVTEWSRFYGRPVGDTMDPISENIQRWVVKEQVINEEPVGGTEGVDRSGSVFVRSGGDNAPVQSELVVPVVTPGP